jgi:hypothetical protein
MNATTTQRAERRQGRELIRKVMLCLLAAAMATMMLAPATAWATEAVTTDSTDITINTDNSATVDTTLGNQGGGGGSLMILRFYLCLPLGTGKAQ